MNTVSAIFSAIAQFFGYQRERAAAKNAVPMQANAAAKTDQQLKDAGAQAIATGDVDQLRKDLAE